MSLVEKEPMDIQKTNLSEFVNAFMNSPTEIPEGALEVEKVWVDNLSEKERAEIKEIVDQLDIYDHSALEYGIHAQSRMSLSSSDIFSNPLVALDMNDVNKEISTSIVNIRNCGRVPAKSWLKKLLHGADDYLTTLTLQNQGLQENLSDLNAYLTKHANLIKALAEKYTLLDHENDDIYYELTALIYAGKLKLEEEKENFRVLESEIGPSPSPKQLAELGRQKAAIDSFEKRINALSSHRFLTVMQSPQITLIINSSKEISSKLTTITSDIGAILGTQLAITVGNNYLKQSVSVLDSVGNCINTVIVQNAEDTRKLSTDVIRATNQPLISNETIEKLTTKLTEGMKEAVEAEKVAKEETARNTQVMEAARKVLTEALIDKNKSDETSLTSQNDLYRSMKPKTTRSSRFT